jgi:hypothetical protein
MKIILVILLLSLLSCKISIDNNDPPILLDLVILDSIKAEENNFFMNGQFQVQLVGDSLISVSSYKSPSVGFYHISGSQRKKIASGDYPIGSFMPSCFDASEYPIVYILDQKSESVLIFEAERQEFLKKVKLDVPDGKEIKSLGSNFKRIENGFLVELASSDHDNLHPDYYRKSESLIYIFEEDGRVVSSFLEYPDAYRLMEGTMKPTNYLSMSSFGDEVNFSFPHSGKIDFYSKKGMLLDSLRLPKSRFFDFSLYSVNRILDFNDLFYPEDGQRVKLPTNDYFLSMYSSKEKILIETWMNNKEEGMENGTFCHLLVYDKKKKKWFETSNPRNILDIGMLAGVVNDTLYFYEGSLMKHDEKYIKRAVLRPIED